MSLIHKNFWLIIAGIVSLELISYLVTFVPALNSLCWIIIVIALGYYTIKDPRLGIAAVMIELVIGSQGRLFALTINEHAIPIRMGIFAIVLICSIIRHPSPKYWLEIMRKSALEPYFVAIALILAFGVANGLNSGLEASVVYSDANSYLYLLLLPVFLSTIQTKENAIWLIQVTVAAITAMAFKTLFLVYVFSHDLGALNFILYKWVRDSRVGEITRVSLDFSFHRVFFQSHIYALLLFGLSSAEMIYQLHVKLLAEWLRSREGKITFTLMTLGLATLAASFSRSNWIGLFILIISLFIYSFILSVKQKSPKLVFKPLAAGISSAIIAALAVLLLAIIPIPPGGSFGLGAFADRLGDVGGEAASSRWNQLKPLWETIKEKPLLGHGFGKEVTYLSNDPRIKTFENPLGVNTTSTFEWGYLDTVTEVGIIGTIIFLIFFGVIIKQGITVFKRTKDPLILGILVTIAGLMAVHMFSPYLNHPLGLGMIMLGASIFIAFEKTITL